MSAAKPAAGDSVPFPFDRDAAAEALAMTEAERAAFGRYFRQRADYLGEFECREPSNEGAILVDGEPMRFWLPASISAEELGLQLIGGAA